MTTATIGVVPLSRRSRRRILAVTSDLGVLIPLICVLAILFLCFIVPLLGVLPDPNGGSLAQPDIGLFARGHLLGTDALGNDVLSRALYGGRISLEVGVGAVFLGFLIGGSLGMLAGYFGGIVDVIVMRLLDILLAFPALVLALSLITYLGANERDVILAISVFSVPAFARLSRGATLQLREQTFIVASRLQGEAHPKIVINHVVPNVAPQVMTFGLLTIAFAMIAESALSFLGLGINPPTPSWGSMIASGQADLATDPMLVLIPGLFLFFAVLSFNMLGDALRRRWA
jgi:peptide/nickel transport system permease protein